MKRAGFLVLQSIVGASCGYVGDPLPPALNIPAAVQNLQVRQAGTKLIATFTVPERTTEDLPMKEISSVDLRIGPNPAGGWNPTGWEASAVAVPAAPAAKGTITATADAAAFADREVVVAVRLANRKGRLSAWSNLVTVRVEAPVAPAVAVRAEAAPEGVLVSWQSADQKARVYRDGEVIGEGEGGRFLDNQAELGKTYKYEVEPLRGAAVSERAGPVEVTVTDRFAPAVPQGLTAIAGANTIELTWTPNAEPDLKGYSVLRATAAGPFEVIAESIGIPAFSDKAIRAGERYRYVVTAVDVRNNRSAQTAPVEITAP